MLYLPSWSKDVTLENFAAWLGRQRPRARYQWASCDDCAVAQWLTDLGYDDVALDWHSNMRVGGATVMMPDAVFTANLLAAGVKVQTFGALRKRVMAYLKGGTL